MDYLKSMQAIVNAENIPYLIGGSAVLLSSIYLYGKTRTQKRSKIQVPPGTVLLYQFPRGSSCPSLSPFPIKLETFLRMNNIPYKTDLTVTWSSKGLLPWMTYNGVDVADSQLCIEHLKKELSLEPNSHLSDEQRGQAHAVRRMLEEGTVFVLFNLRFGRDGPAYEHMLKIVKMPRFLFRLVAARRMVKRAWYQGTGRHSNAEIDMILEKDLKALSQLLGSKKFLFGDDPCEEDCTVFGFLCMIKWEFPGNIGEALLDGQCSNLSAYIDRMKERFWPDWDQCVASLEQ